MLLFTNNNQSFSATVSVDILGKYFYSLAHIVVVSTKCIDPWVLEFVVSIKCIDPWVLELVVSTKCIDPWVLEFVVSNITGNNQWEYCISLDLIFVV
jgi:cellulose synthase/poly-beta-1,6-N-acetylglucosamine synthase-like glycosyltransferase